MYGFTGRGVHRTPASNRTYIMINTKCIDVAKSLFGVLSDDMTLEEAREERLNRI